MPAFMGLYELHFKGCLQVHRFFSQINIKFPTIGQTVLSVAKDVILDVSVVLPSWFQP